MKVQISNKNYGGTFAKGFDDNGKEYFVIGGDLCYGESIEIVKYLNKDDIWINVKVDYSEIEIFSNHFDKHGLIDFNKLKEVISHSRPNRRVYELDGYWVFVENRIIKLVEYLYNNKLIDKSRIKITKYWKSTFLRANVFGIDYSNLLKKVIKKKEAVSSWYICEKKRDFNEGIYADLFIIGNFNETDLQIQLWQIIGEGSEVLYAHGLLDKEYINFNHFDIATHNIDPIIIPGFLYEKKRMELIEKKKWIRIDGQINEKHVFNLIKMFFPLDHLVNEFKEIKINV